MKDIPEGVLLNKITSLLSTLTAGADLLEICTGEARYSLAFDGG